MQLQDNTNSSKRLIKNTLILYLRMFFIMLVTIFTSRLILAYLGVEDYGIYNAVGGIVGLFALISGSMSNSVMRFITFELGRHDKRNLQSVFSTSINAMLIISLIVILLGETIGLWFLNYKMNIPEDRMNAANWVYQSSIIIFVISLLNIPYNATIIANEHMKVFAYVSILESVMKLLIVYAIGLSSHDKLIVYVCLLVVVSLIIRLCYQTYCKRKFCECHYCRVNDFQLLKQLTSFAGWNFLGQGAFVVSTQGVNILLNVFYGVYVNAARGIAAQVQSAVLQFVNSFTVALNPQITKSYASRDFEYMHSLLFYGAKISFCLTFLITLPLYIETETVLSIWLVDVPQYAVSFVRLTLLYISVSVIPGTITPSIHATGRIKQFMIVVGIFELLIFFFSYISFKMNLPPESAYYVLILGNVVMIFVKIHILGKEIDMRSIRYVNKVIIPILLVFSFSAIFSCFILSLLRESILKLLVSIIVCSLSTIVFSYIFGCDSHEKQIVLSYLSSKIKRI